MSRGERVRVLHCIQNLNYGGMERVLADLVRGLDPDRFEPHVLTFEYRGRYGMGLDEVATLHDGPRQGPLSLLRPRALAATIRSIAPDVVHLHSGVWFKGASAARLAGVRRIVYTEHGRVGAETPLRRILHHLASRRTDAVVAVSTATAEQLHAGPRVPLDRIHVISNGIDCVRFAPGPSRFRAARGIPDGTVLLGCIARLEPVKGHDVLLRALRLALDRIGDRVPVRLVLAGDGSLREELERTAAEVGVTVAVDFLGWVDDPEDLLRALDVFVLTSHSEGTSISLLEAMATGACPLVTRVGGNAHVLGPGLAHRLVEPGDPDSVAEGLAGACLDADARRADGRRSRERVEEAFDVASMVEAYARLYTA